MALTLSAPAEAACVGRDLFEDLRASGTLPALQAEAAALPFRRGRLFRLSQPGRPPSYVFGTIHLADPRIAKLSAAARSAIGEASRVLVETREARALGGEASRERRRDLIAALQASPDHAAADLLNAAETTDIKRALTRRSLSTKLVDTLKPGALALLLDLPACAVVGAGDPPYVDALVARAARDAGRPVEGLETLAEQVEVLDDLPDEAARAMLVAVARQAERGADVVETTILRFEDSDGGGLLAFMASAAPIPGLAGAGLPPAVVDRLVTRRTARFVERATPALAAGGAFMAVGLAHLPGPEGLLVLLQGRGFSVEPVE